MRHEEAGEDRPHSPPREEERERERGVPSVTRERAERNTVNGTKRGVLVVVSLASRAGSGATKGTDVVDVVVVVENFPG